MTLNEECGHRRVLVTNHPVRFLGQHLSTW